MHPRSRTTGAMPNTLGTKYHFDFFSNEGPRLILGGDIHMSYIMKIHWRILISSFSRTAWLIYQRNRKVNLGGLTYFRVCNILIKLDLVKHLPIKSSSWQIHQCIFMYNYYFIIKCLPGSLSGRMEDEQRPFAKHHHGYQGTSRCILRVHLWFLWVLWVVPHARQTCDNETPGILRGRSCWWRESKSGPPHRSGEGPTSQCTSSTLKADRSD